VDFAALFQYACLLAGQYVLTCVVLWCGGISYWLGLSMCVCLSQAVTVSQWLSGSGRFFLQVSLDLCCTVS